MESSSFSSQTSTVLAKFTEAWAAGAQPRLEDYLRASSEPKGAIFQALLATEIECRRRRGETPTRDDYLQRFPDQGDVVAALFATPEQQRSADASGVTGAAPTDFSEQTVRLSPAAESQASAQAQAQMGLADPPWELAGYQILGPIGKGGMGLVLRARQIKADRIVALKVIRPDRLEDLTPARRLTYRQRFETEARAAARLAHENIVPVYEVGELQGHLFYSMRYIEGRSLADVVHEGPVKSRRAAEYVVRIARAVAEAHRHGILHRDLKPRNILIDSHDQPFVADFGLAKWDEASDITLPGDWIGTPSYMAPEQAIEASDVTPATDVYGLGATLYALVTGRPPFQGSTRTETIQQLISREAVPPRQLNPAIDRDLETIALKCLHKEPAARYQSAAALADDLQRYLDGLPIQARPQGRPARMWRWCRRNPALAIASSTAVLAALAALGLGITVIVHRLQGAKDARRQTAELALSQGLMLCEQGDVRKGMLWLARSLEVADDNAPDLSKLALANLAAWSPRICRLQHTIQCGAQFMSIAVSPDGRSLLSAAGGGGARIWNIETGEPRGPPLVHGAVVLAVAFSPDGQTVATGGLDGTVRRWEAASGRPRGSPLMTGSPVRALAYSNDGQLLVTAGDDRGVRLWRADAVSVAGLVRRLSLTTIAQHLCFTPDDSILLVAGDKGVQRWATRTGLPLSALQRTRAHLLGVVLRPDGRAYATTEGEIVHQRDIHSDQEAGLPLRHSGPVQCLAYHPGGHAILTGCLDGTARWWDTDTATASDTLHLPAAVQAVAFSKNARYLVTACSDGGIRIWRAPEPLESTGKLLPHPYLVFAAAFSPDGRTLATAGGDTDGAVQLWERDTLSKAGAPMAHPAPVMGVAFSADGLTFATGCEDGGARIWNVRTGKLTRGPLRHTDWVYSPTFTADGTRLVTGSLDGKAQVWDTESGSGLFVLSHGKPLRAVAVHGAMVATGGDDGTIRLWRIDTGLPAAPPLVGSSLVRALAFSPDGALLLAGYDDNTARFWDVARGELVGRALSHRGRVAGVAFSPDGRVAATASLDRTAQLWDVATRKPIGGPLFHKTEVRTVAFSPDGAWLLTGESRLAHLWPVHAAVAGDPARTMLRTEVMTAMQLDASAAPVPLDNAAWERRRRLLDSQEP